MKLGSLSIGFGLFLTLFSLAVSQPVFDMLGKNVEFFLFRQSTFSEIVIYTGLIAFVIPALLFAGTRFIARLNTRIGSVVFALWVLFFMLALASIIVKSIGLETGALAVGATMLSGLLLTYVFFLRGVVYRLIGYMLVIVVIAPAFFLWNSYSNLVGGGAPQVENISVAKTDIPVFVLVFDELPLSVLLDASDNIDELRYPQFARLAAMSTWYRNASAAADATSLAIPAILTGNNPEASQEGFEVASTAAKYPRSLFSLLHTTHNIFARETITRLCPPQICNAIKAPTVSRATQLASALADTVVVYLHLVLPDAYVQRLPAINSNWGAFVGAAEELNWDGLLFSEEQVRDAFAQAGAATLNDVHYIHMNMPHHPWIHYASGKRYRSSYIAKGLNPLGIDWMYPNGHLWGSDKDALEVSRQRQHLQVAYSDKLLGGFLDAIQHSGHFDEALIFVLADHGANIAPGELFRWATPQNIADLMSIPLMVKYPGQAQAQINDRNAQSIDVLPTIADVLGVEHGWQFDGHSLLDLKHKPATSKTILRTIPSTSTEKNKVLPRLISVEDSQIFDKIWRDDFVPSPVHSTRAYLFDRSYEAGWLGLSTTSLTLIPSSRIAKMPRINRFKHVDLSKPFLQGYLKLEIPKLNATEAFMVAVALNSVIHVTRYVSASSTGEIEVILPEEVFAQGENNLDIFIRTQTGPDAPFERLSICSANGKNGPPACWAGGAN